MPTRIKLRLVTRVPELGPCFEWSGALHNKGYGKRMYRGKVWLAHRAAWDEKVGPIPSEMFLCHKCDNPPCVRIGHLFVGDGYDNMRDMVTKGRADNRGERNGRAKLTEDQVREIRKLYTGTKRGNPSFISQVELAKRFNTHQTIISKVVNNTTWEAV